MALIRTGGDTDVRCLATYNRPSHTATYYKDADGSTGNSQSSITLADFSITDIFQATQTITKTGSHRVFILRTQTYETGPVTFEEITTSMSVPNLYLGFTVYSI